MKVKNTTIYILALFILGLSFAHAQVDRSKPPKAGPQPTVNFGEVTKLNLPNGVTALVVENHKLPTVNMNVYLDNGPLYEGKIAGYASFLGDMMRAGTKNYTKEQLDEKMDYLGTDFYFRSSSFGISTLKNKLNESLDLFSEVLFNPTFSNSEELEKLKKQQITSIESEEKNPDAISSKLKNVILYGKNDPYGEFATEETINNIQLSDFNKLYQERVIPNNAYITFVGDITPNEVKSILNKYFKNWQKSTTFQKKNYPIAKNTKGNYIAFVDLPTASQSLITFTNLNDFKKTDSDFFAGKLGNSILGGGSSGRLFKNIREDKGWTYGAYSSLNDDYDRGMGTFSAWAKVRNAVTDSAIVEFMKEFQLIDAKAPDNEELNTKKAEYNGNFVIGLENPSTVASYTRTTLMEQLPTDFYKNYLKGINAVSNSQISAAMKKYVDPNNLVVTIVGKGSEIMGQLESLKMPIKYFDKDGNEIQKPTFMADVPKGVTVETVLNNAVDALGDRAAVEQLKSLKMVYTGTAQGQNIQMTRLLKAPNLLALKVELPAMGMVISEKKFNGTTGYEVNQGQRTDMPASELDDLKKKNSVLTEQNLLARSKELELVGVVPVNESLAYQIDDNSGEEKISYFFDQAEGYLVRTITYVKNEETGEEAAIPYTFSVFENKNGIIFPTKINIIYPGLTIDFSLQSAEINPTLTAADFE